MHISFSALDAWRQIRPASLIFEHHTGDLASLAKIQSNLDFPGLPYADATGLASIEITGQADMERHELRFICSEGTCRPAHRILRLKHDKSKRYFDARNGIYEQLTAGRLEAPEPSAAPELVLFEASILAARYPYRLHPASTAIAADELPARLPASYERDLLELLLDSDHPEAGFEQLRACGFLEQYWPELSGLCSVDHAKDFHPEGDAWRHTMETFSHRKTKNPILSLGLLLHDIGKPDAVANEGRRFDGHADIGGLLTQRFLRRLGYPEKTVSAVHFLVRYHMMPAALPKLPSFRVEEQLRDPLFPLLLELYRCDELSTFRGPDGYYAACAAYKEWCKRTKNPWRNVLPTS